MPTRHSTSQSSRPFTHSHLTPEGSPSTANARRATGMPEHQQRNRIEHYHALRTVMLTGTGISKGFEWRSSDALAMAPTASHRRLRPTQKLNCSYSKPGVWT